MNSSSASGQASKKRKLSAMNESLQRHRPFRKAFSSCGVQSLAETRRGELSAVHVTTQRRGFSANVGPAQADAEEWLVKWKATGGAGSG